MMKRILCIEDDPVFSGLLETHLNNAGHEVQMAGDGNSGLKLAQIGSIDLIFLDVILPDIDGFEICQTMRKTEASKDVPIVMLTGEDKMGSVWSGMELGATDYLIKNEPIANVLTKVNAMIDKYAL